MAVLLIACGGTIASRARPDGTGVAVALTGGELLDIAGINGVDVVDEVHGVVVTHGTDTIEETAYLTWLLGGAKAAPIVFTGAMRHDGHPHSDGPGNLRDAVGLAASGTAIDGPVLGIGGETHHARWVTRTDTSSLDTFRSVGEGVPPPPPPPGDAVELRVAQVPSHTGVDPELIPWHLERGARGLVVEGTGSGNVHRNLVPGIEAAAADGVPVVLTSRCWTGDVAPVYGGPGGGAELAALGCIGGGDLPNPQGPLGAGRRPRRRSRTRRHTDVAPMNVPRSSRTRCAR